MKLPTSPWRLASSVIIIVGENKTSDFSVLMLKRNSQTKFAGSAYVFPGGALHESDCDPLWDQVFLQATGQNVSSLVQHSFSRTECVPHMISLLDKISYISPYFALRICAIRETFEESGVLLVKRIKRNSETSSITLEDIHDIDSETKQIWRKQIEQDGFNFARLCLKHNLIPDVWALYEWSNWLTPPESAKRFDVLFFLCHLSKWPVDVSADQHEVLLYQVINQYRTNKI